MAHYNSIGIVNRRDSSFSEAVTQLPPPPPSHLLINDSTSMLMPTHLIHCIPVIVEVSLSLYIDT